VSFLKDRQRAGIEAAKAKGVYKGRPPTFDRAKILELRKQGMGATAIAEAVGCKRGNVYKALKTAGVNHAFEAIAGSLPFGSVREPERKERRDSHGSQSGSSGRDLCDARRRARRLCGPLLPRLLRRRLSLRKRLLLRRVECMAGGIVCRYWST
jgi:hypothetical protein